MILRWTAAGVLEAERHFRKVAGYQALPRLVAALRAHDAAINRPRQLESGKRAASMTIEPPLKFNGAPGNALAAAFVDQHQYFVSEASVYRLLQARGLITSPAFILLKAADHFAQPTMAINQLWQIDFTYLRVIGWGWFYLSTVLDDFSRYIVAWKLCTTMTAADVSETLRLTLHAAGLNQATVQQRPRLLSDNGPS